MYDFHIHSIFSDGELIPAEIMQRYSVFGYKAIAITDHVDSTNLKFILSNITGTLDELSAIVPGTLAAGLVNPAPPQPPKQ